MIRRMKTLKPPKKGPSSHINNNLSEYSGQDDTSLFNESESGDVNKQKKQEFLKNIASNRIKKII